MNRFRILLCVCAILCGLWLVSHLSVNGIAKLNEKVKEYEYVGHFSEGLAVVRKEGKIGFIDKSGELVIPLKWRSECMWCLDEVKFTDGKCLIPRERDSKEHWIDKEGNEISLENDSNASLIRAINWSYNDLEDGREFYFTLENLCGGNRVGKEDLKEKYGYEYIGCVHCSNDGNGMVTLLNTKTNKYGIVDEKGNIVVPFQYDNYICFCYGLLVEAFGVTRDSNIGLQTYPLYCNVYKEGRLLHEKIPFFNGNFVLMGIFLFPYQGDDWTQMMETELNCKIPASAKKTKLLDMDGKEVSKVPFGKNYLRLSEDAKYWFLEDKDGELVFPKKFKIYSRRQNLIEIGTEDGEPVLCLADDGESVICDFREYLMAGIIQMTDEFARASYPLCTYKKELSDDDNYLNSHITHGYLLRQPTNAYWPDGKKFLPYDVDDVSYFSDGLLRLRVGKRYFFVDKDGNGMIKR